jgi:molybdopterin converting factor subunit 1
MMQCRILLFASAREAVGQSEVEVKLPPGSTFALLAEKLAEQYPALARLLETSRMACQQDWAEPADLVPPNAEIALIPPVSGGAYFLDSGGATFNRTVTGKWSA